MVLESLITYPNEALGLSCYPQLDHLSIPTFDAFNVKGRVHNATSSRDMAKL